MLKGHKTVMLALGWRIETLVRGIADYAREHRWHLVFQNGGDFERDLRNWRGDGLICALPEEILSCRSWENTAIVSLITLRNFPFPYRMIREDDYAVRTDRRGIFSETRIPEFCRLLHLPPL